MGAELSCDGQDRKDGMDEPNPMYVRLLQDQVRTKDKDLLQLGSKVRQLQDKADGLKDQVAYLTQRLRALEADPDPGQAHSPHSKLYERMEKRGFRKRLGRLMEGPRISALVIILMILDVASVELKIMREETDWLNPKYGDKWKTALHYIPRICRAVAVAFMCEQILDIVAFGLRIFRKFWMVLDLLVVTIVFISTLFFHEVRFHFLLVLRIWKLLPLVYDYLLDRPQEWPEEFVDRPSCFCLPQSKLSSWRRPGCCKRLGRFLEGPVVSFLVVVLTCAAVKGFAFEAILEDTKLMNPKYDGQKDDLVRDAHQVCLSVLAVFLVEQIMVLVAFKCKLFTKVWMAIDFLVVSAWLATVTVTVHDLHVRRAGNQVVDTMRNVLPFLLALRLWKFVAFVSDCCKGRSNVEGPTPV